MGPVFRQPVVVLVLVTVNAPLVPASLIYILVEWPISSRKN